ncbi:hypothetical protein GCM10009835_47870 [Planosporangium flavigriseum]|uniref:Uncharacterized protein n=1 Tax=Planosporangium flavigriseum TaxID=373681 RepID=A0A8J3LRS1_9ACTN|nr:hypothetical protein Pfl04_38070 [Planosporangium flavigriseum]
MADCERLDKLIDAAVGPAQLVEDAAPGRLGEYGKGVNGHAATMSMQAYACQGISGGAKLAVEIFSSASAWTIVRHTPDKQAFLCTSS